MKTLIGILALAAVALGTTDSKASFNICNQRSAGVWVAIAYYVPKEQSKTFECSGESVDAPCYYSAWKKKGWWYIKPTQCTNVLGSTPAASDIYVHAEFDDGSPVAAPVVNLSITDNKFSWDNDPITFHAVNQTCASSRVAYQIADCTSTSYVTGFFKVSSHGSPDPQLTFQ